MRKINKFNKIKLILFSFILMFSFSGALCSKSSGTKPTAKDPITMTIWGFKDDEDALKPIISQFEAQNAGVKVQFVKKSEEEYEADSVDAIANGEGPDIWLIKNDWFQRHYKKLAPLPDNFFAANSKNAVNNIDYFKSNFVPIVNQNMIVDNKTYGVPLYIDTLAIYWNKDIFSKTRNEITTNLYKNPTTSTGDQVNQLMLLFGRPANNWDDIITQIKYLTKKDGNNITQGGISLGTSNNIDFSYDILSALMLQNSTQMTTADNKTATFNLTISKETGQPVYTGTNALDFYTSFADSSKENYSWSVNMPNALDSFIDGKLAMMIAYGSEVAEIQQRAPNLNYGFSALPQIKGATKAIDYASYWVYTVTKSSKYQEYAWSFLKGFYGSQSGSFLSATSRTSPNISGTAPEVLDRANRSDPFGFQLLTAAGWNKGRYPLKVDEEFNNMINNVVIYKQPLQSVIDTSAKNVTTLLQK